MSAAVNKARLFATLPPPWPKDLLPAIRAHLAAHFTKVVVLDDDPTGTQTVHGIPVLTEWSLRTLAAEFLASGPGFYILTNSRAFTAAEACTINREIGQRLGAVSTQTGVDFVVISRGDSTLRGHFPEEVEALATGLMPRQLPATILLCPYFEAGGRYTINDVHYVAEGDSLVPAAQTPFARDASFGFRSSNLREWIVEKSHGRICPEQISALSLTDIRKKGPQALTEQLILRDGVVCIANAACQRDLEVIVLGALLAEIRGARTIYRTAASFVATRMGMEPLPLLTGKELKRPGHSGGLIMVGSYVPKTTTQLDVLLANAELERVEISVTDILQPERTAAELSRVVAQTNQSLAAGRDVVVFTSRKLITGHDAASSLGIAAKVSDALVEVVRRLEVRPRYLIAKGGITSSDLATRGLGVKRALVLGQILPGVPVWELGSETKFPGLPYVVFPGNVGGPEALQDAFQKLKT